ncbi:MAG TPA: acyl-CoA dehydrogenase family protein [Acidimicrobiales bacterium]|nr:acyl-CoA dehydrogenase family protein [Acidimicrobiales bacterium]
MDKEQPGRDDLIRWQESKSDNFFRAVPQLKSSLELRMGAALSPRLEERLDSFGRDVALVIEPSVVNQERNREFPKLHSFDEVGRHVERVEFHPDQQVASRVSWGSGMLATPLNFEGAFEVAALFFLLSHVGEGGQACPIVCTIGLRRAIEHRANPDIKERYLEGLTDTDAASALRGSQFLTEVQGGSDVGANVTRATPDPEIPGAWRISGEKWFCSVADADLFAVTARPEGGEPGTKGLACFVIPRSLDGTTPNGFRLRRLKDKLGTRALASAEIDFENALAWPIGALEEGFHIAVDELLNTSRWLNAVGSTGIMSRAYLEASTFAHHRRAFGVPIIEFPAVRDQLARMKIETSAALASTLALTELVGKIDDGTATKSDVKVHRFLVNANKYVTSITATDVVHQGIEVLGGNGTIEDFSPLPRLYRDSIVFESWEGTHNVLCAQVHRDCVRLGLLDDVTEWIRHELSIASASSDVETAQVLNALAALQPELAKSLKDPSGSDTNFRGLLSCLMRVIQATCILREAATAQTDSGMSAVASAFILLHLVGQEFGTPPQWTKYTDDVLGLPSIPQ